MSLPFGLSEEALFFIIIAGVVVFFSLFSRIVVWDHQRARRSALRSKAAESGSPQALYNLALELMAGESESDARRAVDLFYQASEGGLVEATLCLGECYMSGTGVEPNAARAVELWQQARQRGSVQAEVLLAECYQKGQGVPQDEARAVQLLSHAAAKDEPEACYRLALCFLHGRGVPANRRHALKWLRYAASYRHDEASTLLDSLES